MGNEEIARRLGEKYDRTDETMTLETGEQVDYSVHGDRIMLDIRGKSRTVMMYDLRTVAGALRAMYQQEMGGQKNVMEPPHKPGNPRYTGTVKAVWKVGKRKIVLVKIKQVCLKVGIPVLALAIRN